MASPNREQPYRGRRLLLLVLCLNLLALTVLLYLQLTKPSGAILEAADTPRQTLFQQTIDEAARVLPQAVSHQLFALSPANSKLLWRDDAEGHWVKVVAWMNEDSYRRFYQGKVGGTTPEGQPRIWVTLAPQVQEFCRNLTVDDQFSAAFRLKQYLGLDPNRRYQRFVELWVQPQDLFRPCPDPETDDTSCNLQLDRDHPPTVEGVADYVAFFDGLKVQSYSPDGAPWTRLGYTYDWVYGQRAVGASEYMLVPTARYLVEADYSTDDYCRIKARPAVGGQ
ncbi:MAG: hypothetical protein V7752_15485 [Halopseudomonas sp.]